ncbi:PREDICTED: uncharacterized protein LOC104596680 isoform X1 [Nelumbo nucifera]|uniref:Uncharacterized protein LOC104596680 isoform X1 n=1 Tax=Nelumbo nucifera TaxID=4432 RepID=A0A1U8Q325_NELNU|nr:PREDICTED: uncharacterized protein LOC104596680 isoform X1 [Nelumbo nucifera]XP_019053210.1 PREDICTED: uncharacterized protein LOC104596680 isoform X1 [Nelumbo nucifera]
MEQEGNLYGGFGIYGTLYKTELDRDIEAANFSDFRSMSVPIDMSLMNTALHIAAMKGDTDFLNDMSCHISAQQLEIRNSYGLTSLHYAALFGRIEFAKGLLSINRKLLLITDNGGINTPLILAAYAGQKDLIMYLYSETALEDLTSQSSSALLTSLITADMYGLAGDLVRRSNKLDIYSWKIALQELAKRPQAFERQINIVPRLIFSSCQRMNRRGQNFLLRLVPGLKTLYEEKLRSSDARDLLNELFYKLRIADIDDEVVEILATSLTLAAEFGVVEFFDMAFQKAGRILGYFGPRWLPLIKIVVINRRLRILDLLSKKIIGRPLVGGFLDDSRNTILHWATVPGAIFRLQAELQWFKGVEKFVSPSYTNQTNLEGETARALFNKEHRQLIVEGEKWTKEMASSCSFIAALIITVSFAAAFTVPGGNKDNVGIPVFLSDHTFMLFVVSDTVAFFGATASLLSFLRFFTLNSTEDALMLLPDTMISRLTTLFISVFAMMLAFIAAIVIMFHD